MTAQELLRRLKKLARKQGLDLQIDPSAGKGDHARIWLGARRSDLPGMRGEIKPGTFRAICKQLGIDPKDL